MFGTFRGLDRAHAAVMGDVYVTDFEAGALTGQAAWAEGRQAAVVGEPESGFVWSMNCDSWVVPKNSLTPRHRSDVDQVCGMIASTSWMVIRSDGPLHARQADAVLVLDQFAHGPDTPVAEMVVIVEAVTGLGLHEVEEVGGEPPSPRRRRAPPGRTSGWSSSEHGEQLARAS